MFDRPEPISFTATLDKLQAQQGVKRKIGQNQLTGASCREVFIAHGIEVIIKSSSNQYHWSHLIAHFLGGEQSKENLIPGTAVSNYNTLELVEQFIARKLTDDGVVSIDILVNPIYSGESLIPDELVFHLSWHAPGNNRFHFEEIHINPRSYQRVTGSMHKSIDVLRAIDASNENNDEKNLSIMLS